MAICVELQYAEGVGWFLGSQAAEAPQDYHCQFVLQTQAEFGSGNPSVSSFTAEEIAALKNQAANPSPFNLSLEEGALVAGAVLGVWGIGACWRLLASYFSAGDSLE